jgi:hypothetical protein
MTEHPVPRWADRLAHAIPFMVLPSGLWRLGLVAGSSMGTLDASGRPAHLHGIGDSVYIVCLTLFSEAVALTAFGMVRQWGEVVPRWIPWLGGRRVAPRAAIIPATLGSLALIGICTFGFRGLFTGSVSPFATDGAQALMLSCYAPLNLWGPALLVLTWAYYRRRTQREPQPQASVASSQDASLSQ